MTKDGTKDGSKNARRTKYSKQAVDSDYGVLDKPNIGRVHWGDYEMEPWYGNTAYFRSGRLGVTKETEEIRGTRETKETRGRDTKGREIQAQTQSQSQTKSQTENGQTQTESQSQLQPSLWLDHLYVCEYCFKYTASAAAMARHRPICPLNTEVPLLGRLVYRDDESPFVIRHIRGFQHPLFCQNLCLFSKLFLDDKSVYYNVAPFDFYVVYGFDAHDMSTQHSRAPNFKPMGFFSKELVSWDGDNNLACICVFPPFQRQHIGSLLIEFSYEVARVTPGQYLSGPEFPLSPFGRVTYLNFWSRKLSGLLLHFAADRRQFSLKDIAHVTGYRKEDILQTLEYMGVVEENGGLCLVLDKLRHWCRERGIDPDQETAMIKDDGVLL